MKSITLSLVCSFTMIGYGFAQSVTVVLSVDQVRYDSVSNLVSSAAGAATGLLVVDTTGQGFGGLLEGQSVTIGSFIGLDNNLKVVQRTDFNANSALGEGLWVSPLDSQSIDLTDGVAPGQELAFIWLPTLPTSVDILTRDDPYGLANVSNWVIPSDGGVANDYKLLSNTRTGLFGGSNANTFQATDEQTFALFAVVPEARHYALWLAAGVVVALCLRQRRPQPQSRRSC